MKCALIALLFSFSVSAKLLDKILAVVDDRTIMLSEVNRVKSNIFARQTIAPQVYSKSSMSSKEVIESLIKQHIVRSRLNEMGYIITDDRTEAQITSTEKRLGLSRKSLLSFLSSKNLTFEEYFEITRSAIEQNIFVSRIIKPLINVTDQEIRNEYLKKNKNDKTLVLKYDLVQFYINKSIVKNDKEAKKFRNEVLKYQKTGIISDKYKSFETDVLGEIKEDGLVGSLRKVLKQTQEGSFSQPYMMNNAYYIFFVKKRDFAESQNFVEKKQRIAQELIIKNIDNVSNTWFERQRNKHYIKYFL